MKLGYKGLMMFLVEKFIFFGYVFVYEQDNGGIIIGKVIFIMGYCGMYFFIVFFDNYFVLDFYVLGGNEGIGKGFYFIMVGFVGGCI